MVNVVAHNQHSTDYWPWKMCWIFFLRRGRFVTFQLHTHTVFVFAYYSFKRVCMALFRSFAGSIISEYDFNAVLCQRISYTNACAHNRQIPQSSSLLFCFFFLHRFVCYLVSLFFAQFSLTHTHTNWDLSLSICSRVECCCSWFRMNPFVVP